MNFIPFGNNKIFDISKSNESKPCSVNKFKESHTVREPISKDIPKIIRLHKEIIQFHNLLSPLPEERLLREDLINRIKNVITSLWPNSKIETFGSYATNLYLPSSDIDIVIFGKWQKIPLYTLKEALVLKGISCEETTKVIDKAKVPIIKLQDILTDIKVDIAFNVTSGMANVELVKKYLLEYPCLKYLMVVLKQFLVQRELNEVYVGGVGSYGLFLMIFSFLQRHPRDEAKNSGINYGVLLIEFFELYGLQFNFFKTGISVKKNGKYLSNPSDQLSLYIEDPLQSDNDVMRGSYNLTLVKSAFQYAYKMLTSEIFSKDKSLQNILSLIINVTRDSCTEYDKKPKLKKIKKKNMKRSQSSSSLIFFKKKKN